MKFTRCIAGSYGWRQGWFIRFPYNREFLEEFKDVIESEGRSWDAETKTWWVDKSFGSLLKELFENWSHPIELPAPVKKVACALCKGTGLIPFKNKEGKLIPHTFLHCDCHQDEREHQGLSPRDFDFPMSYSSYRSLSQEHGWPDPGISETEIQKEVKQEQVIVHRHSSMSQQEYEIVQGMSKRIESLEKKLAEKQKPRTEYA